MQGLAGSVSGLLLSRVFGYDVSVEVQRSQVPVFICSLMLLECYVVCKSYASIKAHMGCSLILLLLLLVFLLLLTTSVLCVTLLVGKGRVPLMCSHCVSVTLANQISVEGV